MNDTFLLPVTYNGKNLEFTCQLLQFGYTHKIQVDVKAVPVMFEPDEERNFRAYVDHAITGADKVDISLLQAIAEAIEGVVK